MHFRTCFMYAPQHTLTHSLTHSLTSGGLGLWLWLGFWLGLFNGRPITWTTSPIPDTFYISSHGWIAPRLNADEPQTRTHTDSHTHSHTHSLTSGGLGLWLGLGLCNGRPITWTTSPIPDTFYTSSNGWIAPRLNADEPQTHTHTHTHTQTHTHRLTHADAP